MEVVKTTHAGHAKSLASTFDFNAFPNGINFAHIAIAYLGPKIVASISAY
jgi:hypothetical protein